MKSIETKQYICIKCKKIYSSAAEAKSCEENHDLVYVPFERADLKRLITFIQSGEPRLLTHTLITTLMKYSTIKPEDRRSED